MVIKYYDFDYGGCTAHIYEYNRYYIVPTGTHISDWDSVNYKPKQSVVDYHEKYVVDGVLNKPVAFMSESGANSFCYGKPAGVGRYTSGRGEEIVDDFLKEEFDNAILYFRQNFGKYKKEDISMDGSNESIQEMSDKVQRGNEELMKVDPMYALCFNITNTIKSVYNYAQYKSETFNKTVGEVVDGLSQIKDELQNLSTSSQSFIESNVKISDRIEVREDLTQDGMLHTLCDEACISYSMVEKIVNMPLECVAVVHGAGGTGKSHLACNFGKIACYIRGRQFNKKYTGYRVARIDCSGMSKNSFSGGFDAVSNYVQGCLEKIFDIASKDADTLYHVVLDEIFDINEYRTAYSFLWSKLGNINIYRKEVPSNIYMIGTGNDAVQDTKTNSYSAMLGDTGCTGRFMFFEMEPTFYKDGVIYVDKLRELLMSIKSNSGKSYSEDEIERDVEFFCSAMENEFRNNKSTVIPVRALSVTLSYLSVDEDYAKQLFKRMIHTE